MTDLVELAKIVEAATAEQQGLMLEQAWEAMAQYSPTFRSFARAHCSGFDTNAGKFVAALEAHAYESAAMTLVDDDWFWRVGNDGEGADPSLYRADIGHSAPGQIIAFTRVTAATPALALTAAAIRALAAQGEG